MVQDDSEKSVISILYDIKNTGIGFLCIIGLIMLIYSIRDNYKNKHDECRIYENNLKTHISAYSHVLSINKQNNTAFIYYYLKKDSTEYIGLDKAFIDNVQVGDSLNKYRGENWVTVFKDKKRIKYQFSKVPEKECK